MGHCGLMLCEWSEWLCEVCPLGPYVSTWGPHGPLSIQRLLPLTVPDYWRIYPVKCLTPASIIYVFIYLFQIFIKPTAYDNNCNMS